MILECNEKDFGVTIESGFWKHKESGQIYNVTHLGKMKCPETRKWHFAVFYELENSTLKFSRGFNDFIQKFEFVRSY